MQIALGNIIFNLFIKFSKPKSNAFYFRTLDKEVNSWLQLNLKCECKL
jgi:hypothetical protein